MFGIKQKCFNYKDIVLESIDSIKSSGSQALEKAIKDKKIVSVSAPISAFVVLGNDQFKDCTSYTEGFETFTCKIRRASFSHAWSPCCKTIGIGISIGFSGISISRGKAYYTLLHSD